MDRVDRIADDADDQNMLKLIWSGDSGSQGGGGKQLASWGEKLVVARLVIEGGFRNAFLKRKLRQNLIRIFLLLYGENCRVAVQCLEVQVTPCQMFFGREGGATETIMINRQEGCVCHPGRGS